MRHVKMINPTKFVAYFESGEMKSGSLNNMANLFLTRSSHVNYIGKTFKFKQHREKNKVQRLFSVFDDNSLQF